MKVAMRLRMPALMLPAVRLMRWLPLRLKMPIGFLAVAVLVGVPTLVLVERERDRLAVVDAQLAGIDTAQRILAAAGELLAERQQLARGPDADGALGDSLQRAERVVATLAAPLSGTAPYVAAQYAAVAAAMARLRAAPPARDARLRLVDEAVEGLGRLLELTVESTQLVLAPSAVTHYEVALLSRRAIGWLQALAQVRDAANRLAPGRALTDAQRQAFAGLGSALQQQFTDVQFLIEGLKRTADRSPAGWASAAAQSVTIIRHLSPGGLAALGERPADLAEAAVLGDAAARAVLGAVVGGLEDDLLQRRATTLRALLLVASGALGGLALIGYFAYAFQLGFAGAIGMLHRKIDAAASGDLTFDRDVQGRDELADMGRSVDAMTGGLALLVANIRANATLVALSGDQLGHDNAELERRSVVQAESLRQTASSISQISRMIEHNAQASRRADELAAEVKLRAEEGTDLMAASVDTMSRIDSGTGQIGEIVQAIEEIAFQTNILALNAAVEASRAGAAGKGFGVVAGEVRQLATRCAEAAGRIGELLDSSALTVKQGVDQVGLVQAKLHEILEGARQMASQLDAVAAASTDQSAALSQVSDSVLSLDRATHANLDLARRSTEVTKALLGRSHSLSAAVNSVRLAQGSSIEAVDMVERAVRLIGEIGLEAALPQLHDRDGPFIDRDLYVFGIDRGHVLRIMGLDPTRVGSAGPPLLTSQGELFPEALWQIADQRGQGWIEYAFPDPVTRTVRQKMAYVRKVDDDLLVSCGVYRHLEVEQAG